MAGLLSGLAGFGLDDLEDAKIFEEETRGKEEKEKVVVKLDERDFVLDKSLECPVCGKRFTDKVMKSSKARLLGTDQDLRPHYEGVDAAKYDVELCPFCGYAALTRFFPHVTEAQIRLIREKITRKVHLHPYEGETLSYEEALERYKLALANAIVKKARSGEKAYICLKSAWLLRGYAESLEADKPDGDQEAEAQIAQLQKQEEDYLKAAFEGFLVARKKDHFPICGMDEVTLDYLVAVLAIRLQHFNEAAKMASRIMTSSVANARMKEKARDLKDQILEGLRAQKQAQNTEQ